MAQYFDPSTGAMLDTGAGATSPRQQITAALLNQAPSMYSGSEQSPMPQQGGGLNALPGGGMPSQASGGGGGGLDSALGFARLLGGANGGSTPSPIPATDSNLGPNYTGPYTGGGSGSGGNSTADLAQIAQVAGPIVMALLA